MVHGDVRSDNLCLRDGAALLLDWNLASVGNPQFDVAFWLPSLALENGPRPDDVMADCPVELAAYVAGFFASRAGEPDIAHAPLVRSIQRRQLDTPLPWAARVLGLPPPRETPRLPSQPPWRAGGRRRCSAPAASPRRPSSHSVSEVCSVGRRRRPRPAPPARRPEASTR